MPRTYRLPSFNVTANVWHGALPADIRTWTGDRPLSPPDLVTAAQLYYPRNAIGRQLHAAGEALSFRTVMKTGFQQLRVPKTSLLVAPLLADPAAGWNHLDLVEVPAGSGKLYVVTMFDVAHAGFPNEYNVAILSQLSYVGMGGPGGSGSGGGGDVDPPPPLSNLEAGTAMEAITTPPPAAGQVEAGTAITAALAPPPDPGQVEAGTAMDAITTPPPAAGQVEAGTAITAALAPPPDPGQVEAGTAMDAVTSSGGGSVTPGTTCIAAGAIMLPFSGSYALPANTSHWFSVTLPAGTYHVRLTTAFMGPWIVNVLSGNCLSNTSIGNISAVAPCVTLTLLGSTSLLLEVRGDILVGMSYTLEVGTGAC